MYVKYSKSKKILARIEQGLIKMKLDKQMSG